MITITTDCDKCGKNIKKFVHSDEEGIDDLLYELKEYKNKFMDHDVCPECSRKLQHLVTDLERNQAGERSAAVRDFFAPPPPPPPPPLSPPPTLKPPNPKGWKAFFRRNWYYADPQ
jgi:hypothetical protein